MLLAGGSNNSKPFAISERDTIRKLLNGTCQGTVTGGATNLIGGRVGAPFMRNYYTRVFLFFAFSLHTPSANSNLFLLLSFRQFGVQKFTNGSASVFVGFATKKVRTARSTSTTSGATSSHRLRHRRLSPLLPESSVVVYLTLAIIPIVFFVL